MSPRKEARIVLVTPEFSPETDAELPEGNGPCADSATEDLAGEGQLAVVVGKNLRTHRLRRGLTLERLAKASGVSRAMLSQVELGRSMPTIKVVWKVARALDLPFSALISDNKDSGCCVVRQKESRLLTSQDGKFKSRALFPITGSRRVEFYELALAAGATEQAHAHAAGTIENLVVTRGELELHVERQREQLRAGDSIEFDADVPHAYVNRGAGDLIMYMVIIYAERSY
jgi:transcriptional regulator with XRE-family HTH domain